MDGGSNHWKYFIEKNKISLEETLHPPDYITGDFDSITPEATDFFKTNKITKFVHTPDQEETDFTKALRVLLPVLEAENVGFLQYI